MSRALLVDNNSESAAVIGTFLQDNFADIVILGAHFGTNPSYFSDEIFDLVIFSGILPGVQSDTILSIIENNNPEFWVIYVMPSEFEDGFSEIPGRRKLVIKNDDYFPSLRKAVSRSIADNGKRDLNPISAAIPKGSIPGIAAREFLHNEKHEINNHLMTILGSVQMLLAKPYDDPEKFISRLMAIERAARMIARVNGDLAGPDI